MNLSKNFLNLTADVRDQAGAYVAKAGEIAAQAGTIAAQAADTARDSVNNAAAQVEGVKTPVDTLADAGHRFNSLAHSYAERMVEQQANVVKGFLHDGAQRLRMLAKAQGVQAALSQQVVYFDVTRDRVVRDAKHTYEIVADAGRGAAELAVETYARLVAAPQRSARATVKKTRKTAARVVKQVKRKARKAA